jgi:hypothetical protein
VQQRFLDALSQPAKVEYLLARDRISESAKKASANRIKKEIEFERAFVKAGELPMAGPTWW